MGEVRSLIAQANKVVADAERFLEVAVESVNTIPVRREEAREDHAAAKERERQALDDWRRVRGANLSEQIEDTAYRKYGRAVDEAWRANRFLASDTLDTEYQKAVARQIAGLLREESERKLDNIATRSDDPDLQRIVAECKEEVGRATRYVINMFAPARDLHVAEVRKARAEAGEILEHLKHPFADA